MTGSQDVAAMLDTAQAQRRCAYGTTPVVRRALQRQAARGILARPYRNIYARAAYWDTLNAKDRSNHVARALAQLHPSWVFAGLTAATLYGFDHAYALHRGNAILIASAFGARAHDHPGLVRIRMRDIPAVRLDGVTVTAPERTLLDCGLRHRFHEALPIFDSAARQGVDVTAALALCRRLRIDSTAIALLVSYTDPLSENGGESWARAVMIERGFIAPKLQYPFVNPDKPSGSYRADFAWLLPGGRIVVGEYDGMGKYIATPSRSSIQAAVHAERRREDHLRSQGVDAIVRFEFEDISHPDRLERKLLGADIPKRR
ncbi:hypothetical protein H7U32_00295 [Bifidobacterium pullorum subsp. saeculare]|uniref:CTP synthase n=1 Tax=Bifidobacterium pullorum subsp. saeculare TaxID=78257 RepID=A0A939B9F2_9BIFI|nr:hypothetical protein [Bifidobacterium pullorum]MBM6698796.1 hypothetical protein [Bifidobacterium pullorum subsp. saeculare]